MGIHPQLTIDGREEAREAPQTRVSHEPPAALFDPEPFAPRVPGTLAMGDGPEPERFHCSLCLGMGAMDDDTEGPWHRGRRPGARRMCETCSGAGWFDDAGRPCGPPDPEGAQWEPGTHPLVPRIMGRWDPLA